jgi:hypothetical protein
MYQNKAQTAQAKITPGQIKNSWRISINMVSGKKHKIHVDSRHKIPGSEPQNSPFFHFPPGSGHLKGDLATKS